MGKKTSLGGHNKDNDPALLIYAPQGVQAIRAVSSGGGEPERIQRSLLDGRKCSVSTPR